MGTSGSYGGSTKQAWKDARQQILDLPAGGGDGNGDDAPPNEQPLDDLWSRIGDALDSDDPTLHDVTTDATSLSLPKLLPWLSAGGGSGSGSGGGSGGGGGGVRSGGGREGAGSRRQVTKSAARGGTALGAAWAIRNGDAAYLTELGLDLGRLQGLSPARQCAEILEAVLGEGSHPDELALRKASLEALKAVLNQDVAPNEGESLRQFVSSYVFELALVELQRQVSEGATAPADVARKEQMIRKYLDRRIEKLDIPAVIQPNELRDRAAQVTREAIKLLRAGGTAT